MVCRPDCLPYWRTSASLPEPPVDERIGLLGFVADVRPLYVEANLVLGAHDGLRWNEHQSAGGDGDRSCGGIRFLRVGRPRPEHGHNAWIADMPEAFASGVAALITDAPRRQALAEAACEHAVRHFDRRTLGEKQRQLLRSMLLAILL